MNLSLAHTTTPTSNGWIRGAISTVDGIIFNCRDHEYGRYRGLESHKGAVFLVFLLSVSWLRFIVARISPHADANTKEITAKNYFFVHLDQHNGQNRGCGRFKS